jgi:site-specific DNA-methyltransferase (adenine-specific)
MNKLYFGDNLDVLREYVPDESVDLIYLDPPFNSQAQYNVLFQSPQDAAASAQAGAFRDTWTWGEEAEWSYKEIMRLGRDSARIVDALRSALRESDMMAYLAMMAVRLHELHRKLKPSGSLYLHCDPTASHYLKILMDGIFGVDGFTNEIIWQRSTGKSLMTKRLPTNHDVMLLYAGKDRTWNETAVFRPYDADDLPEKTAAKYCHQDEDGRVYRLDNLINPNQNRPNLTYEFLGVTRVWRWTKERMRAAHDNGLIVQSAPGRVPQLKRYLDEQRGLPLSDVWTDIPPLNSQAKERIGYPTQKPLALLDRVIGLSSTVGQTILDPFCGCGTTVEAAERAGRQWIGIDVAVHAIKVIEARLGERLGRPVKYDIEGMPRDLESAMKLAEKDKYQFQWWANYLFNPHALREQKKGADRGVDGELFFPNGPGRPWGRMLTSVKGGEQVGPAMVRDFGRVLEREKAQLGLFICLHPPTREMIREAASVGFADVVHGDIPKLQIVAIEEWFKGKMPRLPPLEHLPSAAFSGRRRPTPAALRPDAEQPELPFTFVGGKEEKGPSAISIPAWCEARSANRSDHLGLPGTVGADPAQSAWASVAQP